MVKAQEFQIVLDDVQYAHQIQSNFSLLQREHIQQLLASILQKYSAEDCIYQFETVALDLGTLPLENYENELLLRLEAQLNQFLSSNISENGNLRTGKKVLLRDSRLEQLEHYLMNGYVQWNSFSNLTPIDLFAELLKHHKAELRHLLKRLGKKESIRKRLIYQYDEITLEQLVTVVSPEESLYIIEYKTALVKRQQEQAIVEKTKSEFRNAIWEVLLGYLFVDSSGYFNKKAFIKYSIRKTADKFSLNYLDLLHLMAREVKNNLGTEALTTFHKIVAEIDLQERNDRGITPVLETSKDSENASWINSLDYFINKGHFKSGGFSLSTLELNKRLIQVLKSKNEVARSLVEGWLLVAQKKERLLQFANKNLTNQLVLLCPPVYKTTVDGFFKELKRFSKEFSAPQLRLIEELERSKSIFIINLVVSRTISEKEIIENLLEQLTAETMQHTNDFGQILFTVTPSLPLKFQKPTESFLLKFYQHLGSVVFGQILSEVLYFISNNPQNIWNFWTVKNTNRWLKATGLSKNSFFIQLHKQASLSKKNSHLITYTKYLVELSLKLNGDQSPVMLHNSLSRNKKERSSIAKKSEVLYVLKKGVLPWWLAGYGMKEFNDQFEVFWRKPETRKEILLVIKHEITQYHSFNYLITANLVRIWKQLDPTPNKRYASFMTVLESSLSTMMVPTQLMSGSNLTMLKGDFLKLLLNKTAKSLEETFIELIRHWLNRSKLSENNAAKILLKDILIKAAGINFSGIFQNKIIGELDLKSTPIDVSSFVSWNKIGSLSSFLGGYLEQVESKKNSHMTVAANQLMELSTSAPKQLKSWLQEEGFRNVLLEELDDLALDRLISKQLNPQQLGFYGKAKSLLKAYKIKLSFKEFKNIKRQFYYLLLITWSTGRFSSWNLKHWSRLVLHCFKEQLGEVKATQILLNTTSLKEEGLEFFEVLSEIFKEVKTDAKKKEPTRDIEEEQPYKKLGEQREREFLHPIFIEHAGLILVAPYLGMLFTRLGLLENQTFINPLSRQKAVQILAYVASGHEGTLEHELIVHKVLCGMNISEIIDVTIPLSKSEKEIAEGMLLAIIQHWTALNNTSIEGLRTSFIARAGKLEDDAEGYYLKVEQKTYDMLLDQIPWNISKIKLSWMKKILNVLWR